MTEHKVEFFYRLVKAEAFNETENKLCEAARAACEKAYAPYSRFPVGCAVLLEDGSILAGSNQENAAFPSGLCAERVALFYAGALAPEKPVREVFIYIPYPQGVMAPCGACRQVMSEATHRQGQPFGVYFPAGSEVWIYVKDARLLLPFPFQFPERK